jgi:outer membrane protein assembly factor BamB
MQKIANEVAKVQSCPTKSPEFCPESQSAMSTPLRSAGLLSVSSLVAMSLICPPSRAAEFSTERLGNWHQWRGPDATGVAPLADPPVAWSESSNVKWKVELPGKGKSTPIVWGNKLFLLSAMDTGRVVESVPRPEDQPNRPFGIKFPNTLYRYVVLCLDRHTGRTLWEAAAAEALPHEGHHGDNSFASASPTTDGQRLYASFGSRGLFCFDLEGKLLWKRDLPAVQTRLSFGEAASPALHGDAVVLVRDNESNSSIEVFDARSGQTRWKQPRDEISAWATPLVVERGGRTQVITNASNRVRSYDLATGEVVWECGGQVSNVTPSPVLAGDLVCCMSGYRGYSAQGIPLDSQGDITGKKSLAWTYDRDTPYVPSPLVYGGQLYFTKSNSAILTCLNAQTGETLLEAARLPGLNNIYASPVGAAERIYIAGRDGVTLVLKRSAQMEVLATNKLDDSIDASPALAGRQLFLRGHKWLYCLEAALTQQ